MSWDHRQKNENLTRCPSRYLKYDTEKEVYTADIYRDCQVVFDDISENKQKLFTFFYSARLETFDVSYLSH